MCDLDEFLKLCSRIKLYSEKCGFYDLVDLGTTELDPVKSTGLLKMCDKLMCVWLPLRLKLKKKPQILAGCISTFLANLKNGRFAIRNRVKGYGKHYVWCLAYNRSPANGGTLLH